jgi:hypothetical protein
VSVPLAQARAFELFTTRMTEFWPKEHSIGESELAEVVLEPRSGGRWFERGVDGSECQWGRVAAPPQAGGTRREKSCSFGRSVPTGNSIRSLKQRSR